MNITVPAAWAPNTSAGKQNSNNGIWTWQDMENAVNCGCFNSGMLLWYLHPGNQVGAGNRYIFSNSPKRGEAKDIFTGSLISRTEANHFNGLCKFYNSSTLLPEKCLWSQIYNCPTCINLFALFFHVHVDRNLLVMTNAAPAQYQTIKMIA